MSERVVAMGCLCVTMSGGRVTMVRESSFRRGKRAPLLSADVVVERVGEWGREREWWR